MDRNILVSIIIPVYNTIDYLADCLNSILNQSHDNLEILIIDDGSTDGSIEFIKQNFKDNRFIFISQVNSGQSIARNNGLKKASGKYIVFVDSDDYLDNPYVIQKMVKRIEEDNADFIQCEFKFRSKSKDSIYNVSEIGVINGIEALEKALDVDNIYTSPWAKIYSRAFLICRNLYFIEGLVNEDTAHSILTSAKSNRVGFLKEVVYVSRERKGSTSRKSFDRMFDSMDKVLRITENQLRREGYFSISVKNKFNARYLRSILYNLFQTGQRSSLKTFLQDYQYCITNTQYKNKKEFKKYLPFRYRFSIDVSSSPLIFYVYSKFLKLIGMRMH